MNNEGIVNKLKGADEVTFRVGPLINLAGLVRSLGCDPAPIFEQAGFNLEEFQDSGHRVPYLRGSRLLALCVEATGCEHLGLLLGQQANPSLLGVVGFMARAAATVEQALKALVENLDLHDEGGILLLNIGQDYSSFCSVVQIPGVSAVEQINDLSITMMYQIMKALCDENWLAARVTLERREPEDLSPYRRFFRAPIHFNATESSIIFPSHCLKRRPPAADKFLYKHLEQEARASHKLQHNEIMEALPAALQRGLLTEHFAARHIAGVFGIHERTLHRRLRSAGTSFRNELDLARQIVSQQLLGTTTLPVCDIADALGYADSSGFIRAFQRWSGESPSNWRKQNTPRLGNQLTN